MQFIDQKALILVKLGIILANTTLGGWIGADRVQISEGDKIAGYFRTINNLRLVVHQATIPAFACNWEQISDWASNAIGVKQYWLCTIRSTSGDSTASSVGSPWAGSGGSTASLSHSPKQLTTFKSPRRKLRTLNLAVIFLCGQEIRRTILMQCTFCQMTAFGFWGTIFG
jgi:hypothetical protein